MMTKLLGQALWWKERSEFPSCLHTYWIYLLSTWLGVVTFMLVNQDSQPQVTENLGLNDLSKEREFIGTLN